MSPRQRRPLRIALLAAIALVSATCGRCGSGDQKIAEVPVAVPTPAQTPLTPRSFVEPLYPHGVPYDRAMQLGQAADTELISLLGEEAMRDSRGNILITLGMLGTSRGAGAIKGVLEADQGQLSGAEFLVKMDAVLALGHSAYVAQTTEPMLYLRSGLNRNVWDSRVKWRLPGGGEPSAELRKQCISALGLSGKDEAHVVLQDMLNDAGAKLDPNEAAQIKQSITTNRQIKQLGMSGYYKQLQSR